MQKDFYVDGGKNSNEKQNFYYFQNVLIQDNSNKIKDQKLPDSFGNDLGIIFLVCLFIILILGALFLWVRVRNKSQNKKEKQKQLQYQQQQQNTRTLNTQQDQQIIMDLKVRMATSKKNLKNQIEGDQTPINASSRYLKDSSRILNTIKKHKDSKSQINIQQKSSQQIKNNSPQVQSMNILNNNKQNSLQKQSPLKLYSTKTGFTSSNLNPDVFINVQFNQNMHNTNVQSKDQIENKNEVQNDNFQFIEGGILVRKKANSQRKQEIQLSQPLQKESISKSANINLGNVNECPQGNGEEEFQYVDIPLQYADNIFTQHKLRDEILEKLQKIQDNKEFYMHDYEMTGQFNFQGKSPDNSRETQIITQNFSPQNKSQLLLDNDNLINSFVKKDDPITSKMEKYQSFVEIKSHR